MNINGVSNSQWGYAVNNKKNAGVSGGRSEATFEEQIAKLNPGDGAASSKTSAVPNAPATLSGEDYLKFYQDHSGMNTVQSEKAAEHKALIASLGGTDGEKSNVDFQKVRERMSASSKAVLDSIQNGEEVSYESWQGLLSELKNIGTINQTDYSAASTCGTEVCIGYTDASGNFVPFEGAVNVSVDGRGNVVPYQWDETITNISTWEAWTSGMDDPLEYLDQWIERYTEWRNSMAEKTNEDGSAKYENLDLIDNQITSLTNVANVIRGLITE